MFDLKRIKSGFYSIPSGTAVDTNLACIGNVCIMTFEQYVAGCTVYTGKIYEPLLLLRDSIKESNKKKKKNQNVNFFQKGGGVDPKVYIFEILNFGKFQVSKWASGMKRLFKVSFKN